MKTLLIILGIISVIILIWYFGFYKKSNLTGSTSTDNSLWKYIGENHEHTVGGTQIFNLIKYSIYTTAQKNTATKNGLVSESLFIKVV